ncbi:hypothetical protein ARMGADRAFT_790420 [Armillaria gallica]|uniref:Uncharacterized protein n=1 Tax=Armillaria gallica TaxID=47427 RepID=A0A2H3E3T5_ARMGA|nr:hypothetical protein ARMGADRAFT_790420 [Armillaria gallica]
MTIPRYFMEMIGLRLHSALGDNCGDDEALPQTLRTLMVPKLIPARMTRCHGGHESTTVTRLAFSTQKESPCARNEIRSNGQLRKQCYQPYVSVILKRNERYSHAQVERGCSTSCGYIFQLYTSKTTQDLHLFLTQCLVKTLNSVNISEDATNKNTVSNETKIDRQNIHRWDTWRRWA